MSAAASLPVCQVIVVLPISVPPGTGFGSARRTTPITVPLFAGPITVALFAGGGEDDAVESGDGRPQPMMERPASIRQIAATHEIPVANGCFLSVNMIELDSAPCPAQQLLQRRVEFWAPVGLTRPSRPSVISRPSTIPPGELRSFLTRRNALAPYRLSKTIGRRSFFGLFRLSTRGFGPLRFDTFFCRPLGFAPFHWL